MFIIILRDVQTQIFLKYNCNAAHDERNKLRAINYFISKG